MRTGPTGSKAEVSGGESGNYISQEQAKISSSLSSKLPNSTSTGGNEAASDIFFPVSCLIRNS